MPEPKPETLCARPADEPPSASRPLVPPIHLSTVYRMADLDQVDALYDGTDSGFVYARDSHPNAVQLAQRIARLEGAEAGLVCASGMGAEAAAILALVDAGSEVALSRGLYGKTGTLVIKELGRFGVGHSLFDATRPATLRAAITPKTRLAFVETLSNPLVRVADIPALAEIARSAGIAFVVDHTFAPGLCRPIAIGADLVVHSLTKFLSGHSDVTLGVVVGTQATTARIASVASTFGMTGDPFQSWLALRGLTSFGARLPKACNNALELARRLEAHPAVRKVFYPGLPSHPDHALATRLFTGGFGAMLSFEVADRRAVDLLIRTLEHIPYAPSLGDASTTLSHPTTTSHRFQTPEQWAEQEITPGTIRLSVGIEDVDDIWRDLGGALDRLLA